MNEIPSRTGEIEMESRRHFRNERGGPTTRIARRMALALLGASSVLAIGCSDGGDTTGRRIVLGTTITAGPEATEPFTTSQGWTVSLSKILISTGPLYYFDGAVILSRQDPPSNPTFEFLERYIGIRSAHAHPGHYVPGNARGEVLVGTTVDLHDGPARLVTGEGVTGLVRSATFSFGATPEGPLASELGSHLVVVEGTANRGDETRAFRAELDLADVLNAKKMPVIEGCPFEPISMESDGVVTITVRVPYWFDQVEFDEIPAAAAAGADPTIIPVSSIARNELVRGMKAGDAYLFSYSKK